jgi:hypothetical protein
MRDVACPRRPTQQGRRRRTQWRQCNSEMRNLSDGNQTHPPPHPLALAKLIGDIATGQVVDAVDDEKDPAAVESGKRGGSARAERLSVERRSKKERVEGNPDPRHISTSYAERANLSIRMGGRRFTRLTNALSKKVENHAHAVVIYFMHYNFVRIHQTLRCSPAMAAGVTTKLWELSNTVKVLEDWEAAQP